MTYAMICVAAALAMAAPAAAQDVLTLDAAVAQAAGRNPALQAAGAAADEAAARVGQAQSRFFPRVTVSEGWQRGNAPVFVFSSLLSARRFSQENFAIEALNFPDSTGFFHGVIGVEQVLFDGGQTGAGVDTSKGRRVVAVAVRDERALALAVDVAAAYGQILTAESARAAADGAAGAAAEDVTRAQRRRDAGTVSNADVLSLQVHLAQMRQRAIDAAGQAAVARATLNRLRGAAVDTDFTVQEPPLAPPAAARDWRPLAQEAMAGRPDLQRLEAEVQLAASSGRAAKAAWWPQVAAQAGYQYDGLSFADRASAWVVGAEARWSLSTGMGDKAAQKAAAAADVRARAELADARAAVEVEVIAALRQLESAEAREGVAGATVAQARESHRILRDRYDAGLAGVPAVLAASAAVLEAERARVSAVTDRVLAQAALDRAIGRRP
jgi:outer membrane protein TolC